MTAAGTGQARPAEMLAWGREVLASQPFSVLVGTELAALSPGKAELRLRSARICGSSTASCTAAWSATWPTTR